MNNMKKQIIIAGASGTIGRNLAKFFHSNNYSIITLSRNIAKTTDILPFANKHFSFAQITREEFLTELSQSIAVINLSGASIGAKKWTEKYKNIIIESRVNTTRQIVTAIINSNTHPLLINSSATGYYGNSGDAQIDENSEPGNGFLSEVSQKWEAAAMVAATHTRVVLARKGFVLAPKAPALKKLLLPFKFFAGGPLGSGKQWMPWIHIDDICLIYQYIIENADINGAVNVVSPDLVRNSDFMQQLGEVLHRPSAIRTPAFALKLLLGKQAELVLDGQRVIPSKLIAAGYNFKFSTLKQALKDIIK